ncbi:MAG: fimbrial protein, partial [Prevotellaceae bacterium]|nr:fimbrial protein [Prevotellaceae bacterium]
MKKSLFFVPLFMAAFASCTNEDTVSEPVAETGTSFLSVNLVNTPSMGTRATEDAENYEDGTATENDVKSILLYLFDKDKKAVKVKGNGTLSHLDLPSTDGSTIETGEGSSPNVEKTINATLVIETPKGDNIPTSIIAVLNPTENLKKADITSIDDL